MAQRMTQWAMIACTLLGAACFAAPRGLEAPTPDAEADQSTTSNSTDAGSGSW
jgi:starvation-inducible outer membrane lipoprotein